MQAAFGLCRKMKGSPISSADRMLGSTPEIEEPDLKENMFKLPGLFKPSRSGPLSYSAGENAMKPTISVVWLVSLSFDRSSAILT